ncbi:hypothetical protein [Salinicola rhizosphaerae]|uniref:Uncharacterized protein n=1 Tax=Salinicola rhizosphaerae TaxID=1443141 RepID=A0ABQ3DYK7_9GAMM|nr:hypothetical protein [Salinicola rhizosphaerae]GHB19850.1 hypothetical protein GCM10009038_18200 [Salinicola rhizosphaerae]
MNHRLIVPATKAGKTMLVLFVAVILAGVWPVVLLANQAALLLGLPLIAAWSCLIILASSGVMLLANRLLPLPDTITRAHEPDSQTQETSNE